MKSEIIAFENHFDSVTEKKDSLEQEIDKNLTLCYKEKIELLEEESKFEKMNSSFSEESIIPRIVCSNLKPFMGFAKKAASLTFELLFKNPEAFLKFTKLFKNKVDENSDKFEFIIGDIVNLSFCDFIHKNKGTLRFLNAISLLIREDIDEFILRNNNCELKFMSSSTILGKLTRAFLDNSDNRAYSRFIVKPIISELEITENDLFITSFEQNLEDTISPTTSNLLLKDHESFSKKLDKKILNIIEDFYTFKLGEPHIQYQRKDLENNQIHNNCILSKKPDDMISPERVIFPSNLSESEKLKKELSEKLIMAIIDKMKYMPIGLRLLCKLLSKEVEENKKISSERKNKITRQLIGLLIFSRLIKNQWLDPDIYNTSYSCLLSNALKTKLEEAYKWICLIVLSEIDSNTKIKNKIFINLCKDYVPLIDKYVLELTKVEFPNLNDIGIEDEIQITSVVISLQAASIINKIIVENISDFTLIDELFGKIPQRLQYYLDQENKGDPSSKEFEYEYRENIKLTDIKFKKALKYIIINDINFKETKLDNEIRNDKLALAFQHLLLSIDLSNYVQDFNSNDSKLINLLNKMNKLPEFFAISQSYCLEVKMLSNFILLTIKNYSEIEKLNNQLDYFMKMYKVLRIIVEEKSIKLEKEINMSIKTLREKSYNLKEYKMHFLENFLARKIAKEFILNIWKDTIYIEFKSHKKPRQSLDIESINSSSSTNDLNFRFRRKVEEEKGNLASAIFVGKPNQILEIHKVKKNKFPPIKSVDEFIKEYGKYPEIRDMIVQNKDNCGIGKVYLDFIDFIEIELKNLKMIKVFPPNIKEAIYDQIENYIIVKMYSNIYPSEASPQDVDLLKKMQKSSNLKPEAFEVKPALINEDIWKFVMHEIRDFDIKPTPSQKMKAIVNAFKTIGESVKAYSQKEDAGGADDLLPILVYCITKAQPKRFSTNLNFIRLFRNPKRINGEAEYCLKNMYFSENFIFRIDEMMKNNNSMDQKEEKTLNDAICSKEVKIENIEQDKKEIKDILNNKENDGKEKKKFKEFIDKEEKSEHDMIRINEIIKIDGEPEIIKTKIQTIINNKGKNEKEQTEKKEINNKDEKVSCVKTENFISQN